MSVSTRYVLLVLALAAGGCRPAAQPADHGQLPVLGQIGEAVGLGGRSIYSRLQDEDPDVRMRAILEAGRTRNRKAAPFLVDRLSDSEAEVRFAAILALQRIAGTKLGYEYYAPEDRRTAAIRRWRQWLKRSAAAARRSAGPAATAASPRHGPPRVAASRPAASRPAASRPAASQPSTSQPSGGAP
ncbi:MAG: HEAT repeat domain-containing protein [Planctomycetes bacterium]|nr:HEAT repeat domain-containing protein [Planctomycetota bacterium]